MRIDEYNKIYGEKLTEKNVFNEDQVVALAGRVMSIRAAGAKLIFIDLVGDEHKV